MEYPFVSIYFFSNENKTQQEQFPFPKLGTVFPEVKDGDIQSKELSSSFKDEESYVLMSPDCCYCCGLLKQTLILEGNREITREVRVRYDDTHHNGTETHLNIDLLTRDSTKNRPKKHENIEMHSFILGDGIQALYISLTIPGNSIERKVIILPTQRDLSYHQKQQEFFRKVKCGLLTEEDKALFREEFDSYSEYIRHSTKKERLT